MAKSYLHIILNRTNGPNPRNRYGIILAPLQKFYRKFLVENRHVRRWADDDQVIECILKTQRPVKQNQNQVRGFWDAQSETLVNFKTLENNYNQIDWQCAISLKPIKAKFMNFDLENFVHSEYTDVLKAPMVDSRILKSSIEFRKKCKKLLLEEREEFLKLVKKGAKRSL